MNRYESSQTFDVARRRHLIEATIEALADVGFKAASLRQIALRADVSTGLFAHYFGDKDGLLEATLRFMAARLQRATIARLRAARTARERLFAVADSALAEEEFDRRTSAVWLAFWGQITHSVRFQRVQSIYQQRMLSNLRHDLREFLAPADVAMAATMIAAMIDGLWIRSHAAATQPDGADARRLVHTLIDRLIAGAEVDRRASSALRPGCAPVAADARSLAALHRGDVAAAVDRAARGLGEWRAAPVPERQRALRRCAEGLLAERDTLARLDAVSTGRAWSQTADLFVPRAARIFERCADLAVPFASERIELGSGRVGVRWSGPIGIVAGRGHWSAPLFDACCQAAPALAFGNAMIFQPSELATTTAERLVEIVRKAGVPNGVFSLLSVGEDIWRALVAQAAVTAIPVAEGTARAATVVFRDADLDVVADAVLLRWGRWQRSPDFSETPIFVEREALASFQACLKRRLGRLKVGDPLDPVTDIGKAPSRDHLKRILGSIEVAIKSGATAMRGGTRSNAGSDGRVLYPTIVTGCVDVMSLVQGGLHAPVMPLLIFDDEEDLIARLNVWGPNLSLGLFSADLCAGLRVATRVRASLCCINDDGSFGLDESDGFVAWACESEYARYHRKKRWFLGEHGKVGT